MSGITYAIIGCYVDKGMKSKGSKALIKLNHKSLLDYQIDNIIKGHKNNSPYEILFITNFELNKINKNFNQKIRVINCLPDTNPLVQLCNESKYKNIFFIDYGCIYSYTIINNLSFDSSYILTTNNNKHTKLDTGVVCDDNIVQHIFFDLPNKKFTNMFFLDNLCVNYIIDNKHRYYHNLMYFEIINNLIDSGKIIRHKSISNPNLFIYFNNMRQVHGINKFIKSYAI